MISYTFRVNTPSNVEVYHHRASEQACAWSLLVCSVIALLPGFLLYAGKEKARDPPALLGSPLLPHRLPPLGPWIPILTASSDPPSPLTLCYLNKSESSGSRGVVCGKGFLLPAHSQFLCSLWHPCTSGSSSDWALQLPVSSLFLSPPPSPHTHTLPTHPSVAGLHGGWI